MPAAKRFSLLVPLVALGASVVIGLGALTYQALRPKPVSPAASGSDSCRGRAFAEIGGPFSLVNQDGAPVSEKSLLGRPALLYFGFTHCPDICPYSLQKMAAALDLAGPKAGDIQPVFVTLDPERDTPEALRSYVASSGFAPGLQGFTGTPAQIDAAAKAFRVGYRKVSPEGSASYLIDHTSIFYLLDSKGQLATFFSHDAQPDAMGRCLADLLADGL
jgi:protein SCO1/2